MASDGSSPPLVRVAMLEQRAATTKELAEQATRALEQAIVDARQDGSSLQEIADAAGVSRQRIHQILAKAGEADGD